jgi:HSP20 family protein
MLTTIAKRNRLNPLLEEFFKDTDSFFGRSYTYNSAKANFLENKDGFSLEMLVPGIDKEDIEITLDDFKLNVKFEKENKSSEENSNYSLKEFSSKSFERSFVLPKTSNLDEITSECKNGVLYIKIPKKESENKKKRLIEVS